VLPPRVDYPSRKPIWIPKVFGESERRARMQTYYRVLARLKPDVTIEQARDELSAIADRMAVAMPATNKDVGILVDPVFERVTGAVRPILVSRAASPRRSCSRVISRRCCSAWNRPTPLRSPFSASWSAHSPATPARRASRVDPIAAIRVE
jgi:hypothetical protein